MKPAAIAIFATMLVTSAIAAPGDRLCVTEAYVETGVQVKEKPNKQSETVMTIGAGRMITEFGREDGWIYGGIDRAAGRDGYVPEDSVSRKDLDGMVCGT